MAILRNIECDVCHATQQEQEANAGWPGWGAVQGVQLNGIPNPSLCPDCLTKVMVFIDGGLKNVVD